MIPFGTAGQVFAVYLLVVVLGALGGLTASLLLHGAAGRLEMPRRGLRNGEKFYDFGFISEVLIGVVAAGAALWLIDPGEITSNGAAIPAYPAQALIGICLVAGVAGGALVAGLAGRAQQVAEGKEAIMGRDTALIGMRMALDAAETQSRMLARRGEFVAHPELEGAVPAATIRAILEHVEPKRVEVTYTSRTATPSSAPPAMGVAGSVEPNGAPYPDPSANGAPYPDPSANGQSGTNAEEVTSPAVMTPAVPVATGAPQAEETTTEIIELEVEEKKAE